MRQRLLFISLLWALTLGMNLRAKAQHSFATSRAMGGQIETGNGRSMVIGANLNDYIEAAAPIDQQRVLLGGRFQGSGRFGFTQVTSRGFADGFVAIYDQGQHRATMVRGFGLENFDVCRSVGVLHSNSFLATGSYSEHGIFNNDTLKAMNYRPDVYVWNFNASGNTRWIRKVTGYRTDIGWGIAGNQAANSVVAALTYQDSTFIERTDRSLLKVIGRNELNLLLVWYDTLGNYKQHYNMPIDTSTQIQQLMVDAAGNLYGAGYFSDTLFYNGGQMISAGWHDGFMFRFRPNGSLAWIKPWGQSTLPDVANGFALYQDTLPNRLYVFGGVGNSINTQLFPRIDLVDTATGQTSLYEQFLSGNIPAVIMHGEVKGLSLSKDRSANAMDKVESIDWGYNPLFYTMNRSVGHTLSTPNKSINSVGIAGFARQGYKLADNYVTLVNVVDSINSGSGLPYFNASTQQRLINVPYYGLSDGLVLTIDRTVNSLQPVLAKSELKVWPNPATDWVQWSLPSHSGAGRYTLRDALGRVLATGTEQQLTMQAYSSGFYTLQVETSGRLYTQTLLKP